MVSIVTITFNDYEGLIKTVESLRGVENIEHIVVNGGQCEKTRRFLENYSRKIGIREGQRDFRCIQ